MNPRLTIAFCITLFAVCCLSVFTVVMIFGSPNPPPWVPSDYVWIPSCTGNGGRWGPPQYYDGYAPNGWYPVWTGLESENGEVFFPLCPNSGSQLHGTWKTAIHIEQDFGGEVRVEK